MERLNKLEIPEAKPGVIVNGDLALTFRKLLDERKLDNKRKENQNVQLSACNK